MTSVTWTSRPAPLASTTCAVNPKEPARVGTPLTTPFDATLSPGGVTPLAVHVYGAVPPDAVSVDVNGALTSPIVREAVALRETTVSVN